jgi:hypothetical protein
MVYLKRIGNKTEFHGGEDMNQKIILIHRILFSVCVIPLATSLIFYLIKWNQLPDEIGMHFDFEGNFDVVSSKIYGFYPHVIGGLILAGMAGANHLIETKNTGLKITEKGEKLFKAVLILTLDCFTFMWSSYFSFWAYSVSTQSPLNTRLYGRIESVIMVLLLIGIGIQNYICIKYKTEKKYVDSNLMHRLSRLIPWLLTAGGIWAIAESWNRHPSDEELYFNPEYQGLAYFENFNAFGDKRLLLIPQILIIALLVIFEILSAKATKANNNILVSLTDKLKLICGVFFFWWNLLLDTETRIGIVSVGLFGLLCIISIVTYITRKNKIIKKEN